jgi:hypothetical protein
MTWVLCPEGHDSRTLQADRIAPDTGDVHRRVEITIMNRAALAPSPQTHCLTPGIGSVVLA